MGGDRYDDEKPVHEVWLPRFSIMEVPVTRDLYAALGLGETREVDPRLPLTGVSWFDACAFCNRASERAGLPPAYEIEGERVTAPASARGWVEGGRGLGAGSRLEGGGGAIGAESLGCAPLRSGAVTPVRTARRDAACNRGAPPPRAPRRSRG